MPAAPASLIARLARKELREILRDRRTVVTLVLMPLLLYPLLGMAFNYFLLGLSPVNPTIQYRVAVRDETELRRLLSFLFIVPEDPEIGSIPADDVEAAVRAGRADAGIEINGPPEFNPWDVRQSFEFRVVYRSDSALSTKVADFLTERLTKSNARIMRERLRLLTKDHDLAMPVHTKIDDVGAGGKGTDLSALIPLVLVLMTITGAVYPAIDLTAGERERGTLEILMAAPVPRIGLLLAKYAAVMTVAVLTGLANLVMMTVTLLATGLGSALFPQGIGPATILAVVGLLVLFAAFFSAVLLAVTSFARSFKEAQAYLIPVMLLAISPGVASVLPGMKLGGGLTIAPLINVVLMARELLEGGVGLGVGTVVVLSTLLYALAAISVAARLFGAEAVLYSEQAQFSDLFRRPRQARGAAAPGPALLCLAVAFPLTFLLNRLAGFARELPVELQMTLLGTIFVAVFMGIPLVSAYFSHVELHRGFRLDRPPPLGALGALLLGLSLWIFILQLTLFQERAGFTTLPDSIRQAARLAAEQWKQAPVAVLIGMALIPGIVEEFFFRGYLFTALERSERPYLAVPVTAVLFGVFHLFPSGVPAIERLLPSTLMGLVLGLVRWRSGSLWPGVLLHIAFNGMIISAAIFPGLLGAEVTNEVPAAWLAGAGVVAAPGAVLVWFGRRTARPHAAGDASPA